MSRILLALPFAPILVFAAALIFAPTQLFPASDGFVSLIPKQRIEEFWIAESAPPDIWSVRDGVIYCKGKPNGFLRSRKVYRNFILRAEWRFEPEGWVGAPEKWPNAGFFIFANEIKDTRPVSLEVQGYHGEAGACSACAAAKSKEPSGDRL